MRRAGGRVGRVEQRARAAAALLAFMSCGSPEDLVDVPPLMEFRAERIRIATESDTMVLAVEIAETQEQRAVGLMERRSLPQDAGMLFLYDQVQPETAAFWMFRTRIPLDIAFLDGDGRIVAIQSMEPCPHPTARLCPSYAADTEFMSALEVNRGYFERHGIGIGDRVLRRNPSVP